MAFRSIAQLRRERRGVLELKARCLARDRRLGVEIVDERGKRRADVARHGNGLARGTPDMPEELGDRRLAVGAGHRDEAVGDEAPRELELADDRDAERERSADRVSLPRDTGALDHAGRSLDPSIQFTIQVNFDAGLAQPFGAIRLAGIDPGDLLAPLGQEARRGLSRAREPDDQVGPGGQGRSIPRRGHEA